MRRVLKMAGVGVAVIAVLTVLMATVAMAGAGGSTNPNPGTCINNECLNEGQCLGDCNDCLCDSDKLQVQQQTQLQDCLGAGERGGQMNQNQGETSVCGDCLCDGNQVQQQLQQQDGECIQEQQKLQDGTCGEIDAPNQACAGECNGEQLQNQSETAKQYTYKYTNGIANMNQCQQGQEVE